MKSKAAQFAISLGASVFLFGCSEPTQSVATVETVKAEDIALTKNGSFMCLSQDWANQFFEHAIKGEETKLNQILDGGECSLVKDGMKVKVLAVRGSVSEVVRVDVEDAIPLWAATEFLQPSVQ